MTSVNDVTSSVMRDEYGWCDRSDVDRDVGRELLKVVDSCECSCEVEVRLRAIYSCRLSLLSDGRGGGGGGNVAVDRRRDGPPAERSAARRRCRTAASGRHSARCSQQLFITA